MHNSLTEWHVLHSLNIQGRPTKALAIIGVRWQPTPRDWMKVNIDGSTLGTLGAAGAGAIFRNAGEHPQRAFDFPSARMLNAKKVPT
ncbi:conserved hypothetical protein [Ricinus communis]|uniref:RNase H type-1 domain-containing protein n=1 Tax=Ricinus communis TaxID=3988 RepID=B9RIX9_RICCO|nr:conserved hypothetical protein [Ricinus communis]